MQAVQPGFELIIYTGVHEVEMWKPIPIDGFNEIYSISNLGRIKSIRKNKCSIKKSSIKKDGYLHVELTCGNKKLFKRVHVLVGICFVPNPLKKPQINHINGRKSDPHWKNLEWSTGKENTLHAVTNGLFNSAKGERHASAKLTAAQVIKIREQYKRGHSPISLSKEYKVADDTIRDVVLFKTWKHVS